MSNKWCKECKGSYPIYICAVTGRLATEYEIKTHCISGGKECQKKIDSIKQSSVKKLKLTKTIENK